jgi:hypothetical protein
MPSAPIVLSDAQRAEVETLAALLNQEQIADYLGVARNTFRAICERDAEVAARYKRGKAKAIAHVANGLLQKARNGDTTSMIFYLKTQAGWRETERLEHSGPDGQPIATSARETLSLLLGRMADGADNGASDGEDDGASSALPRALPGPEGRDGDAG